MLLCGRGCNLCPCLWLYAFGLLCDIYAGELVAVYDDAVVFCYATDNMGVFCFYDMVFCYASDIFPQL